MNNYDPLYFVCMTDEWREYTMYLEIKKSLGIDDEVLREVFPYFTYDSWLSSGELLIAVDKNGNTLSLRFNTYNYYGVIVWAKFINLGWTFVHEPIGPCYVNNVLYNYYDKLMGKKTWFDDILEKMLYKPKFDYVKIKR